MLEVGMKAPAFTLKDQNGNEVSLSDFAGRKVVLYFYPRDNTPGCTRQACAFAAGYEAFKTLNAAVIGVSKDSVASHVKFAQKYELPFTLLADPELEAIQAYGVWQEKKLYGKTSMGVVRTTFIIDENGVVENTFAFNVGTGYLYAPSSASNQLKTHASIDENSSWSIVIDSSCVANIVAQGESTRNVLMYNLASNLFSCYSSAQEPVAIYKLIDGENN